ncbi:hypothetical protein B4915_07670 [Leucobacter massiliensis]|uniref:LysM domain-containing protein n=1 Tax=Leucobacter massiliensis TaxID=1686285 RepID=A0A2S9QP16_9MICO|nr:hypothetical protein B4915_07670 [Leucobacter massiliensis]
MPAGAVPVEAPAHVTGRLRLTRRGRVVLGGFATVLIAGLLAFIAALGAPQAIASDAEGGEQQFHYAVVQPGSSLWELASELDPAADPRDLVAEIVRLNQLEGSGVEAGQPLAVPLRYSESSGVVSADELGL